MDRHLRTGWSRHVDQIIRSRHYTWLGEGLGGEPLPDALECILTDILHICERQGVSFDDTMAAARRRSASERAAEQAEVQRHRSARVA